ncbi:MAG: helicase-associated domain-containing protein [Gemmataceae bacterium]|nr:helicase-associated domain-containing protein [Gemmataceae bacterium]
MGNGAVETMPRTRQSGQQSEFWSERLRETLEAYDEPLLRGIATRLFKPRNQWPVDELLERSLATIGNPPVIDRRIKELEPAERRVLALIAHSRQLRWDLGNLVFLVMSLGHPDGLPPILNLLEAGLLYPILPTGVTRLKSFDQWLGQAGTTGLTVFAHPAVIGRALGEDLGLPDLSIASEAGLGSAPLDLAPGVQEADGLDWPLRLSALWQLIAGSPMRRTQQGSFFKRDLERLCQDPLVNAPPVDGIATLPDVGLLTVALAENAGMIEQAEGELRASSLPDATSESLFAVLASLTGALFRLDSWDAQNGGRDEAVRNRGNPYPSAYLLSLLLLARLPADKWADATDLETWLFENHPYWKDESARPSQRRSWLPDFLLGLAYQLRLVQAMKTKEGGWHVRLGPFGRWFLGLGELPAAAPSFPQTLLVQPNLEIVAYRQGLTPALISQLARLANWRTFGSACTLQLAPESAYRALQSGLSYEGILQVLQRHGMRAVPPGVVEALRTWANKRERISAYPSATLFEFASADDLNAALARGLPATRIADRLAIVPSESAVDFRHFRLAGTRDYALPPDRCVEVEPDGVTLSIDLSRSDLLVETELQRFALPKEPSSKEGRRQYLMTPESVATGRDSGLGLRGLEEWFTQRTGQSLSASGRLLMTGSQMPPAMLRKHLVLHVETPELADGLVQWPGTRSLIEERLGPTALSVAEENVAELRNRLRGLGLGVKE